MKKTDDKSFEIHDIKPKNKVLQIYNLNNLIYPFIMGMILLICLGVNFIVGSAYDMNDGPEKQRYIVAEANKLSKMSVSLKHNGGGPKKFIGGARSYLQRLYSSENKPIIKKEFERLAKDNGWEKRDGKYYKDKMTMLFRMLDENEYSDIKHLKGKTVWTVEISIE